MKNTWKWIIGIVVILVVVAGLVGLGFVAHNAMAANRAARQAAFSARATAFSAQGKLAPQSTPGPQNQPPSAPPNGFTRRGFPGFRGSGRGFGMPGGGYGFNRFGGGPGMMGRAAPFGPGAFILGGLARLVMFAFFLLLLVGAFWLGRKSNAPAPVAVAPTPLPVAAHACSKCGNSVQDDAKFCPSCGKKQ